MGKMASNRGKVVHIMRQYEEEVPKIVCCEEKRLKIIMFYLIQNSIERQHTGDLHIRVCYEEDLSINLLNTSNDEENLQPK